MRARPADATQVVPRRRSIRATPACPGARRAPGGSPIDAHPPVVQLAHELCDLRVEGREGEEGLVADLRQNPPLDQEHTGLADWVDHTTRNEWTASAPLFREAVTRRATRDGSLFVSRCDGRKARRAPAV
jgi:hypothetical protein